MRFIAVVEIPSDGNAELPSSLARAAYDASSRGPIALLMPTGVSRAVDRGLDSLVASNRRVHGVVYRQLSDVAVWKSVDRNTLVVGSSTAARDAADATGARCVDAGSGMTALQDLRDGTRQPELRAS